MVRYYRELTRLEMEAVDKEETVVLIPIGALEQHGNQCPLGTDEIISEAVARRIRETLDREIPDYPMLIFPPVPVGLSTEHVNFCGSITLKPDTFYHVLEDICRGLFRRRVFREPGGEGHGDAWKRVGLPWRRDGNVHDLSGAAGAGENGDGPGGDPEKIHGK